MILRDLARIGEGAEVVALHASLDEVIVDTVVEGAWNVACAGGGDARACRGEGVVEEGTREDVVADGAGEGVAIPYGG